MRAYFCVNCMMREVKLPKVRSAWWDSNGGGPIFIMRYECDCLAASTALEVRFVYDQQAFRRLFGRVSLPYVAADQPIPDGMSLGAESDRLLRIFGWECGMLRDVEEFLLFARRADAGRDDA